MFLPWGGGAQGASLLVQKANNFNHTHNPTVRISLQNRNDRQPAFPRLQVTKPSCNLDQYCPGSVNPNVGFLPFPPPPPPSEPAFRSNANQAVKRAIPAEPGKLRSCPKVGRCIGSRAKPLCARRLARARARTGDIPGTPLLGSPFLCPAPFSRQSCVSCVCVCVCDWLVSLEGAPHRDTRWKDARPPSSSSSLPLRPGAPLFLRGTTTPIAPAEASQPHQ